MDTSTYFIIGIVWSIIGLMVAAGVCQVLDSDDDVNWLQLGFLATVLGPITFVVFVVCAIWCFLGRFGKMFK